MIGNMEIGTLTAFITYLSQVLMALTFMANIFLQGTRAAASDRRILEVLEAHSSITDENASRKDFEIEKGKIEFRNVSFRYFKRNKIPVLNQIDLNIKEGSFVYNSVNSFLSNKINPSSLILLSSLDIALRSTDRKSASCCRLKGMVKWLLL